MVIEILGAIAADAAGESMHKSKEKRKLEDAKDNPEEYAKISEEIEKRKERNNKMAVYLIGIFFVFIIAGVAGIFFATILIFLMKAYVVAEVQTDSEASPGTISPSERQALMSRKCSVPGCNTGNFRMTDYCHKHQDHISSNSEPETEGEENWWEDQKER